MDVFALFQRIGYVGPSEPTAANLSDIHRTFMLAVPFENLDIHLGRRIFLDESAFFEKVVRNRRGGFCYELNGLFAHLLRQLGYDVSLLSARVFNAGGKLGREFVHLLLLVNCGKRWIADVGFGDLFTRPICLDGSIEQTEGNSTYRIIFDQDHYVLQKRSANDPWQSHYSFALLPRQLNDFAAMCEDLQTSRESVFRKQRICTRATENGRITLVEDRLIMTDGAMRREIPLTDELTYNAALEKYFGIIVPTEWRKE